MGGAVTTPRLSGTMGRAPVKTLLSDHFLPAWVGEGGGALAQASWQGQAHVPLPLTQPLLGD